MRGFCLNIFQHLERQKEKEGLAPCLSLWGLENQLQLRYSPRKRGSWAEPQDRQAGKAPASSTPVLFQGAPEGKESFPKDFSSS